MKTASPCRIGLYPGTFDPITLGHLDIISRAARMVDLLYVGVAENSGKEPLFPTKTRLAMVRREIAPLIKTGAKIEVLSFSELLMDCVVRLKASVIIRGLRAVSDFEYEFQMAGMNARLNSGVETMFLMASERHQFIASRFVKEIARLGGDVTPFVSKATARDLQQVFVRKSR